MNKGIFTSKTNEWETPEKCFDAWDREFDFTLDPCGSRNRLLKSKGMITYFPPNNGLEHDWDGEVVFINPPYSLKDCKIWCKKCFEQKDRAEVMVILLPLSKASTKYFHKYIYPYAEIRLIKGRLKFFPLENQKRTSNPMGSMLCIIRREAV